MTGFRQRTGFSMPTVLVKCGDFDPIPLSSTDAWKNRCGRGASALFTMSLYPRAAANATGKFFRKICNLDGGRTVYKGVKQNRKEQSL